VKPGTVFKETADHTSVLQFVESTFSTKAKPLSLPTIAPGRRKLSDLVSAFDFKQSPQSPSLPSVQQLYPDASNIVLALNGDGTVVDCTTNLPTWLPEFLGVSGSSSTPTATATPASGASATPTPAPTTSAAPTTAPAASPTATPLGLPTSLP
jgi:phospholipase C